MNRIKQIALMLAICFCVSCVHEKWASEIHASSKVTAAGASDRMLLVFIPYTGGLRIRPFARSFCALTETNGIYQSEEPISWYWIIGYSTNTLESGITMTEYSKRHELLDVNEKISMTDFELLVDVLSEINSIPPEIRQFTNQLFQAWEKRNDLH